MLAAIVAWLLAANLAGSALAVLDKSRARRGLRRIRESTFFLIALAGGWLGTWLAFIAVHHKTRKPRFLIPFFLCALVNAGALWWMWQRGSL